MLEMEVSMLCFNYLNISLVVDYTSNKHCSESFYSLQCDILKENLYNWYDN